METGGQICHSLVALGWLALSVDFSVRSSLLCLACCIPGGMGLGEGNRAFAGRDASDCHSLCFLLSVTPLAFCLKVFPLFAKLDCGGGLSGIGGDEGWID